MKKHHNYQIWLEIILLISLAAITYITASYFDIFESISQYAKAHEEYELDEIFSMLMVLSLTIPFILLRRYVHSKKQYRKLEKAYKDLDTLRGFVPICSNCHNIRDDEGYWHKLEAFIESHSLAEFSHSICPKCMKELYPELIDDEDDT